MLQLVLEQIDETDLMATKEQDVVKLWIIDVIFHYWKIKQ